MAIPPSTRQYIESLEIKCKNLENDLFKTSEELYNFKDDAKLIVEWANDQVTE